MLVNTDKHSNFFTFTVEVDHLLNMHISGCCGFDSGCYYSSSCSHNVTLLHFKLTIFF